LPVKLKPLLSDRETQSVELKEFPVQNRLKQIIFQKFADNSKKQISFAKSDSFLPIEILQKPTTKIEEIKAFFPTDDDKEDPIQLLLKSEEIYFYAKLKDSNILQPLDTPLSVCETHEKIPAKISVKGIPFYSKFTRIRSKDKITIKIGKSMTIELNKSKVTYNLAENLRDIVVDVDFMMQVMLNMAFEINGKQFPVDITDGSENFNIEEQQSLLNYHKKMVQILDYLNIKDDIKISELTDMDRRNFSTLITAFIDNKKVKGIKSESPLVFMKILNFNLLLLLLEDKNNADEVEIYDFFQIPDKLVTIKEEDWKRSLIPQYIILKKEDYLKYSNTRYDSILTSFQKCYSANNSTIIIEAANKILLDLLLVYDESKEKKSEILCTAKDLAKWLLEINNSEIFQLNLLQTIKREREFTKEEKDRLLLIAQNSQNTDEILFGANILLDYQEMAEHYFKRLDSTAQETHKQYPICKFKKL
jgi:hypothetical protein